MTIDKAKKICSTLVDYYGNNAIDIQGGEPTIYQPIYELVRYCRDIGLLPTLITNGIALAKMEKCLKFQEAGVRDFLFSVHGLGDTYDQIVGNIPGASERQMQALGNCLKLEIPVRFNCVLSKNIIPQLTDIAKLSVQNNVRVVNFIAFNCFEDQRLDGKRTDTNVPKYSEMIDPLHRAMDVLEDGDIECNVRYYPICLFADRHRKSIYSFQQLPYDLHEWDYASWSWTGMQPQKMKKGGLSPAFSLEYATYGRYQLDDKLKFLKNPVEKYLARFPVVIPKFAGIYRAFSRAIIGISKLNDGAGKEVENVYQDNGRLRAQKQSYFSFGEKCRACSLIDICGGFHSDYAKIFGTDEAEPITHLPRVTDPKYFIQHQDKVVEREDYAWAL
jgi:MoaA/NifB/PqqE/SkfB family radical SAM enzyme